MLQVLRHLHGADHGVAGQQDVLDVLLGVGVPGVEASLQHCPWHWGGAAPGGHGGWADSAKGGGQVEIVVMG